MDCLDPPLTAMPTGRWMCPNHIEHVAVSLRQDHKWNGVAIYNLLRQRNLTGTLVKKMT